MLALLTTAAAFVGPSALGPARSVRSQSSITMDGKFITGSYLKGYTVGSRAPPGAVSSGTVRGSAADIARPGVNYNVFANQDANQFRYPRFGDLQGTRGNAERSAAIPGASQFIFGYLALLTELSRVCEGAPPNVVLHQFDVTPLTLLGIASPLNL